MAIRQAMFYSVCLCIICSAFSDVYCLRCAISYSLRCVVWGVPVFVVWVVLSEVCCLFQCDVYFSVMSISVWCLLSELYCLFQCEVCCLKCAVSFNVRCVVLGGLSLSVWSVLSELCCLNCAVWIVLSELCCLNCAVWIVLSELCCLNCAVSFSVRCVFWGVLFCNLRCIFSILIGYVNFLFGILLLPTNLLTHGFGCNVIAW